MNLSGFSEKHAYMAASYMSPHTITFPGMEVLPIKANVTLQSCITTKQQFMEFSGYYIKW